MKLFAVLALCLSSMSVASAATSAIRCGAGKFTGFFAGTQIGLSSLGTKMKAGAGADGEDGAEGDQVVTARSGGVGPSYGLHAGYGYGYGNFAYFGTQLYGNYSDIKIGASSEVKSLKSKYTFGVALEAAGMFSAISNTMFGAMLGFEWRRLNFKNDNPDAEQDGETGIKKKFTKFGFRPGLFTRTLIGQNMFLGLNTSFGMFGKLKTAGQIVDKNLTDARAEISLSYKF